MPHTQGITPSEPGLEDLPAEQLSALYGVLSRIFIAEVDEDGLAALKSTELVNLLGAFRSDYPSYLYNAESDQDLLDDLAVAYCHLFILPGAKAAPLRCGHWASMVGVSLTQFEQAVAAYAAETPQLAEAFGRLPTDHLALVLSYLSSAYGADDTAIRAQAGALVRGFVRPWADLFVEKLLAATDNPVYGASGELFRTLVQDGAPG